MRTDGLMFELIGADGHKWLLYEDGVVEGFPDGIVVVNRLLPMLSAIRAKVMDASHKKLWAGRYER